MFYKSYYFFQFKIFSITNLFYKLSYHEDLLLLKKPKLIYLIDKKYSTVVFNINTVAQDNSVNISSKTDKKSRVSLYEQNSVKYKNSKSKIAKSKRKEVNVIKDVKILNNVPDDLLAQDFLTEPNDKLYKGIPKSRKKFKLKQEISKNNDLSYNNIQSEENIKNLAPNYSHDSITLTSPMTIQELSVELNVPNAEIITYLFLERGTAATINQMLDTSTIQTIAKNYGFNVVKSSSLKQLPSYKKQEIKDSPMSERRSPIITILGHVDHGKTTLLDAILNTNLVRKEYGQITQAISGYEISFDYNYEKHNIIFLDTPGHESFKKMRLRGARVTDIILLVIAIDDGIQPQTIEVINYINHMTLSCIIVITKADKLSNNVNKIKKDLANYDLVCEDLGGKVPLVEVSSISGKNIESLLSKICKLSISKNLLADSKQPARGTIIESYLDKQQGAIANILVQNGTLKVGDIIASENLYGKVKSITNISRIKISSSGPSSIVQILGFTDVPPAGSLFYSFNCEKDAKKYCLNHSHSKQLDNLLKSLNTRITLNLDSNKKQLKLIIKTDSQGALEAILDLLSNISQYKVQINIVSANFGNISNKDIELALATNSFIVAFNVSATSHISSLLKKYKISFKFFNIIYDLFEHIRGLMLDLIQPEYNEILVGNAIVKTVFNMNQGYVAGCTVNEGKLTKNSYIYVYRDSAIVYQGYINSLKRMKNDIQEVIAVTECGLTADFQLWKESDKIEAYDLVPKEKAL
uniref:Translation initiation factor IF-2, chloroplastic n=1 Tax=Pleurostichidium falkenbergii TaxID=121064 RepID=A0A4D6UYR8_9FLOR|nr:translation initiation factor 2 [Pleurostichidium falkenbergii]QCH39660.1 translation initiation factor 2 [Pleurostichidium falkenbergii]